MKRDCISDDRSPEDYVIGVDVGTGSARASLYDLAGRRHASSVHPIDIYRPQPDFVEQSSRDIWQKVCQAVRDCITQSAIDPADVKGISFDATCSLVALDDNDQPVSVALDRDDNKNIIVWMDHRATKQTDFINSTGHRVLQYVGGKMSPEQQPPKLKWIKENLQESWKRTRRFFDLPDYLVYEACKQDIRSLCTVVCKWTYLGHEGENGSWDRSFFEQVGLEDLFEPDRIGDVIRPMGTPAGSLTQDAADQLGLSPGTVVGVGIIDAHSGGLGSLGMAPEGQIVTQEHIEQTLALIGGTSSCHMGTSPEARYVPGVWGPYYGAMIPGTWLTEGGQSATGALLDFVIQSHPYSAKLHQQALDSGVSVYELLNQRVTELRENAAASTDITADLHMLPDFNGNRSPVADPHSRGMWSGLSLDGSMDSLARQYLATIQAIAYGTRQIIQGLNAQGYSITQINASGGGTKNPLWMQEHADICGVRILIAQNSESVTLGAAILAAVAAGKFGSIIDAMAAMSPKAEVIEPHTGRNSFHERKYQVFKSMYQHQLQYRQLMND